jgi:uncharacterized membrane protein YidH (DUF202 family)
MMAPTKKEGMDSSILGEIQLILAEKRTALAALRTGIAVFALPLSVLSLLIATSRYYQPTHVLHLLIPLLVITVGLAGLGGYLIVSSVMRIHRHDRMIRELKRQHSAIAELVV